MGIFNRGNFDFKIPAEIEEAIALLEDDVVNDRLFDCTIENLRAVIHGCQDMEITEEEGEELIDYYYRRKWQ